jgi:hypothetical protein
LHSFARYFGSGLLLTYLLIFYSCTANFSLVYNV